MIVLGAVDCRARDTPGKSAGVSPAVGAWVTGWPNSAGVSPILGAGCAVESACAAAGPPAAAASEARTATA